MPEQWLEEVALMHRGDAPDWREWTLACRASWAQTMVEILDDEGFWWDVPDDDLYWLLNLVEPEYGAMSDKEEQLAQWFRTSLHGMPREQFSLSEGKTVGSPTGWYIKITLELSGWSNQRPGWQEVVLGWLEKLRIITGSHNQSEKNIIHLDRTNPESPMELMSDLFARSDS